MYIYLHIYWYICIYTYLYILIYVYIYLFFATAKLLTALWCNSGFTPPAPLPYRCCLTIQTVQDKFAHTQPSNTHTSLNILLFHSTSRHRGRGEGECVWCAYAYIL